MSATKFRELLCRVAPHLGPLMSYVALPELAKKAALHAFMEGSVGSDIDILREQLIYLRNNGIFSLSEETQPPLAKILRNPS